MLICCLQSIHLCQYIINVFQVLQRVLGVLILQLHIKRLHTEEDNAHITYSEPQQGHKDRPENLLRRNEISSTTNCEEKTTNDCTSARLTDRLAFGEDSVEPARSKLDTYKSDSAVVEESVVPVKEHIGEFCVEPARSKLDTNNTAVVEEFIEPVTEHTVKGAVQNGTKAWTSTGIKTDLKADDIQVLCVKIDTGGEESEDILKAVESNIIAVGSKGIHVAGSTINAGNQPKEVMEPTGANVSNIAGRVKVGKAMDEMDSVEDKLSSLAIAKDGGAQGQSKAVKDPIDVSFY